VGLAHAVKVSLCLLLTAFDLAFPWLGSMALTKSLGLDNAIASFRTAVTAFVFQVLVICRSIDSGRKLGTWRHCCCVVLSCVLLLLVKHSERDAKSQKPVNLKVQQKS
jgi:hypothetical protein